MHTDSLARTSHRVRRLLRRGKTAEENNPAKPPLPFLPAQRRPLTPAPSCDFLVARPAQHVPPDSATGGSLFFASLPLELRREVLISAFGERMLHLDLRLNKPLLSPDHYPAKADDEHYGTTAPLCQQAARNRAAPKT
jgi:hypothetical protein